MKRIIVTLIIDTITIIITCYLLVGVKVDGVLEAAKVAVLLALANTFLKPILKVISTPLRMLTLGLFSLVINAFIVWLVDYYMPGFEVTGYWNYIIFGIILWILNSILSAVFK